MMDNIKFYVMRMKETNYVMSLMLTYRTLREMKDTTTKQKFVNET